MDSFGIVRNQPCNQKSRYRAFLSVYMNRGLGEGSVRSTLSNYLTSKDFYLNRSKFNISKLLVDIIFNKISKNKPRAKFLPVMGNDSAARKSKMLEKWSDYMIGESELRRVGPLAFLDALIYGTGFLKSYRVGDSIRVERIDPSEVFVDEVEAKYDNVRQKFHRKLISREVVEHVFVDMQLEHGLITEAQAKEIREALKGASPASMSGDDHGGHSVLSDPIEVVEVWHLPSGKGAKDGRHVICIEGATLSDDEWKHDSFPIKPIRWSTPPVGYYGIGLIEELLPVHVDINDIIYRIERCAQLNSSPTTWIERGSNIAKAELKAIPGLVMEYTRTKPETEVLDTVPKELMNYLREKISTAYSIARIDRPADGSTLPGSFQTGSAVRSYADLEKMQYAAVMQEYERLILSVIKDFVRLGREIYEVDKSYTVVAAGDKGTIDQVPWEKIDLEKDFYTIRVMPSTALSDSVGERIEETDRLVNSGYITREDGLEMLDLPDTERIESRVTANSRLIDFDIEQMLDDGEPAFLDPHLDTRLVVARASAELSAARRRGVDEEKLTLLRNYLRQAATIEKQKLVLADNRALQSASGPIAIDQQGQDPQAAA